MQYNYQYRLAPPKLLPEELRRLVDICSQMYKNDLYLLNDADDIPTRYEVQKRLPDLKTSWGDLLDGHSKALQIPDGRQARLRQPLHILPLEAHGPCHRPLSVRYVASEEFFLRGRSAWPSKPHVHVNLS